MPESPVEYIPFDLEEAPDGEELLHGESGISRETIHGESHVASAAEALEAQWGRSLGEQTLREEYELCVNVHGEVVYLKNLDTGKPPQRVMRDGGTVDFMAERTDADAERYTGAADFTKELLANRFTTRVDENNSERGSLTAITKQWEENGLTYVQYTIECYNAAPVEKPDPEEFTAELLATDELILPTEDGPSLDEIRWPPESRARQSLWDSLWSEFRHDDVTATDIPLETSGEMKSLIDFSPLVVTAVSSSTVTEKSMGDVLADVQNSAIGSVVYIPGDRTSPSPTEVAVGDVLRVVKQDHGLAVTFMEKTQNALSLESQADRIKPGGDTMATVSGGEGAFVVPRSLGPTTTVGPPSVVVTGSSELGQTTSHQEITVPPSMTNVAETPPTPAIPESGSPSMTGEPDALRFQPSRSEVPLSARTISPLLTAQETLPVAVVPAADAARHQVGVRIGSVEPSLVVDRPVQLPPTIDRVVSVTDRSTPYAHENVPAGGTYPREAVRDEPSRLPVVSQRVASVAEPPTVAEGIPATLLPSARASREVSRAEVAAPAPVIQPRAAEFKIVLETNNAPAREEVILVNNVRQTPRIFDGTAVFVRKSATRRPVRLKVVPIAVPAPSNRKRVNSPRTIERPLRRRSPGSVASTGSQQKLPRAAVTTAGVAVAQDAA